MPVVDLIGQHFRTWLEGLFPALKFTRPPARFIPTFDIDIAYAHLGKGFPRALAAWSKLVLSGKMGEVRERWLTLAGKMRDPYDNFLWIQEKSAQYGYDPVFFVLVGDFGKYDRNISYRNPRFRKLLQQLSRNSEIGIHPSYASFLNTGKFLEEKQRLEQMIGKEVTRSRFHFLRMKFPDSYRILSDAGIRDDHSLGYSTVNGYRAGTFTPFKYYDLEKESGTDLKLHPFIFMDSAMIDNMKLGPAEAMHSISGYIRDAKKLSGELTGTWHNYALSEKDHYKGWQKVLEFTYHEFNTPAL
jgi:hypothetical protein